MEKGADDQDRTRQPIYPGQPLARQEQSRVDDQSASPMFPKPSGAALGGQKPRLGHASRGSDRSSQALCVRTIAAVCY